MNFWFNGSSERTNGKGNIKCICQDAYTAQPFECQLTEAHSYNGSKSLISLGLLLRKGWKFTADLESCLLVTPDGNHTIRVHLGNDNILYFKFCPLKGKSPLENFSQRKISKYGNQPDLQHPRSPNNPGTKKSTTNQPADQPADQPAVDDQPTDLQSHLRRQW